MFLRVLIVLASLLFAVPAFADENCPPSFKYERVGVFKNSSTVPNWAKRGGRTCVNSITLQQWRRRHDRDARSCTRGRKLVRSHSIHPTPRPRVSGTRSRSSVDLCLAFARPGEDTYDPPAPASVASGRILSPMKGVDAPGSDYRSFRTASAAQCAQRCKGALFCAAFSWESRRGMCFLKNNKPARLVHNAWVTTGVVTSRQAPRLGLDTRRLFNTEDPDDLRARLLMDARLRSNGPTCAEQCLQNDRCDGYVEYPNAGRCELLKRSSSTPYQLNPNHLRNGNNIRTVKRRKGRALTRPTGGRA